GAACPAQADLPFGYSGLSLGQPSQPGGCPMAPKYKRTRLWVDPPFQFRLLARTLVYLLIYSAIVWHIGFFVELVGTIAATGLRDGIGALYVEYFFKERSLLIGLVLIAPVFLYDLLKFSHRVAGPLYRCRNVMQEMADGKPVAEFKPREND